MRTYSYAAPRTNVNLIVHQYFQVSHSMKDLKFNLGLLLVAFWMNFTQLYHSISFSLLRLISFRWWSCFQSIDQTSFFQLVWDRQERFTLVMYLRLRRWFCLILRVFHCFHVNLYSLFGAPCRRRNNSNSFGKLKTLNPRWKVPMDAYNH